MLTSDLDAIQEKLPSFLSAFCFPILAIGLTVLLIVRLSWPGVLGILFVIISFPLTNCIAKKNREFILKLNEFKDRRIRTTKEVIEGINHIKMNGWEIAFRKMIQKLRDIEINYFEFMSRGHSLERALGMFIGVASAYIMYLVSHYANTGLDLAKIFSCL